MLILDIILKILKSRLTYIILAVIFCLLWINTCKQLNSKVDNRVQELEIQNDLLQKELLYIDRKVELENSFTNSKIEIEKIENRELTELEKNIINSIHTDFNIM